MLYWEKWHVPPLSNHLGAKGAKTKETGILFKKDAE